MGHGRLGRVDQWLEDVVEWFDATARDLPWRGTHRDPWAVLVSEVMLQQTPVERVRPVYEAWLDRWPTPGDLASDPAGEAVRMWGRLGYPRRALRLHATAVAVTRDFAGVLPDTYEELVALPGIGDYTASAVLAFAHRRRVPVLDTNVRRVLARVLTGFALPTSSSPNIGERAAAEQLLPADPEAAAHLSEALMELGALVCRSRSPECEQCPLASSCLWLELGRPDPAHRNRPQAKFEGSDRQARGAIMAVLRGADGPVPSSRIQQAWHDVEQRRRAQDSLVADGLIVVSGSQIALP